MRLYDNAYASNYEELKTYYPVWYRDFPEMDALWRVSGKQLDDMRAGIVRGIANCFISTADLAAIRKLEEFLYVTYDGPRTLEERRTVVASFFYGTRHIGEKEIKEVIRAFTTGEITVDLVGGAIEISVTREISERFNLSDCLYVLYKRIPAHLGIGITDILLPIRFTTSNAFLFRDFGTLFSSYNGKGVEPIYLDGARNIDGTWTLNQALWGLSMPEFGVEFGLRNENKITIPEGGINIISSARNKMEHRLENVHFRYRFFNGGYGSPLLLDGQNNLDGTWLLDQTFQGLRFQHFGVQLAIALPERLQGSSFAVLGLTQNCTRNTFAAFSCLSAARNRASISVHDVKVGAGVRQKNKISGSVTIDSMYELEGSMALDSSRKLNANIVKEVL